MNEREKVIKAFEFCMMPPSREELENDICSHEDCPYYREYNGGKCISAAASDALALLKAQEPRLLGLDEIKMLGLMWLESRNGFVQPVICQNYEYCVDRFVEFIMVHGTSCNSINTFGKLWRVWTSKPSDEQMEAVKWE